VKLRLGVVLARDGGALPRMARPARLGLGAKLGSGRQGLSWIHVDDLVALALEAARNPAYRGPVNATAPEPASNAAFTRALARRLRRPLLPVPGALTAAALGLALGEMAREMLLQGAYVVPGEALRQGFRFRFLLARARAAGVRRFVCCATREADWDAVLALAREHEGVLPMLGLHPWFVDQALPGWLGRLRALLASGAAGLGECGLDFTPGRPPREAQERAFRAQAALAVEFDLPLAIHAVRAWEALAAVLRETGVPAAGALVHDYPGSAEMAVQLASMGLHLSFSGAVLRPDARRGPRALAAVAADRLLLESDAPRWAHADASLLRAEPAGVAELLRAAAALRGVEEAALAAQVTANAHSLFRRLLP